MKMNQASGRLGVKILVNSDKNISTDRGVIGFVEAEVTRGLKRFARRLTRVEVHLSDVNSHKFGTHDKRCMIEVRPAGSRAKTATVSAATLKEALAGALKKMRNSLETKFGRLTTAKRISATRKKAIIENVQRKKKGVHQARREAWPARAAGHSF
jgi:hypothetical protein